MQNISQKSKSIYYKEEAIHPVVNTENSKGFCKFVAQSDNTQTDSRASQSFKTLQAMGFERKVIALDTIEASETVAMTPFTRNVQSLKIWVMCVRELYNIPMPSESIFDSITQLNPEKSPFFFTPQEKFEGILALSEAYITASSKGRIVIIKTLTNMLNDDTAFQRLPGANPIYINRLVLNPLHLLMFDQTFNNNKECQAWIDGCTHFINNAHPTNTGILDLLKLTLIPFQTKYKTKMVNGELNINELSIALQSLRQRHIAYQPKPSNFNDQPFDHNLHAMNSLLGIYSEDKKVSPLKNVIIWDRDDVKVL